MNRVHRWLPHDLIHALSIAGLASLATTAPALAASTLPKAGEPIGTGDLIWIAGAGALVLIVGLVVRRRLGGS